MKRTRLQTRVRDFMTCPAQATPPGAPLEQVAELLADGSTGAVPVVDADGLLLGLVTEGDLLRDPGPREPVAAAVMSAPLVAVGADQTAAEAEALMLGHRVHHLPVVDRSGHVVGMVARDGVASALGEDESELRTEIVGIVHACGGSILALDVHDGVVRLHARVPDIQAARTLEQRVNAAPGVRVLIPTTEWGGELGGQSPDPAGAAY
ncbi:CBS domain-containing protein [Actinospica sp. MGRD01-02]|uniref:CBS domain-containing protein n=1 Tax=Actinospica acidithermotolerans TaxID=2828514 RepID=A0A941IEU3_9ACTN|nr:CBS domain-containing protein [Actinospica acidithermotolerans]MBR7825615.1 CBS domain-containing protein [Actinospica acidithermotolerans]